MSTGSLVVCGTPLGNLDDLSPRAATALREAAVVACEDTRRTGRLYAAFGWATPRMIVVNEHTEATAAGAIVDLLRDGTDVVLVSDAGMPAISDPGVGVVAAAVAVGIQVSVIPGPTAMGAAVAASGLPTGRFVFEGFLPRKGSGRAERLTELAGERRAIVLYEAPHRMQRLIADLLEICRGDRPVSIGREITKLHEEWFRGDLAGAAAWLPDEPRGEFVVVVAGAPAPMAATDDDIKVALADARARGASTRDAVAEVVDRLGVAKRRVYDLANG